MQAFRVAEEKLGIPALLDAEDMVALRIPDRLSILTYVSQYYNYFHGRSPIGGLAGIKRPAEDSKEEPAGKKHLPVVAKQSSTKQTKETEKPPAIITTASSKPAPATAKAAEPKKVLVESTNKTGSLSSTCAVCKNHVHLVQRHLVDGKLYHRNCFRCKQCSNILLSGTYKPGPESGTFICTTHQHNQNKSTPSPAGFTRGGTYNNTTAVPAKTGLTSVAARNQSPAVTLPTSSVTTTVRYNVKPSVVTTPAKPWTPTAEKTQVAREKFFQSSHVTPINHPTNSLSAVNVEMPGKPASSLQTGNDKDKARSFLTQKLPLEGNSINNNHTPLAPASSGVVKSTESQFTSSPQRALCVRGPLANNGKTKPQRVPAVWYTRSRPVALADESEEVLMVDWFKLIRQKQLLMRRESELVYIFGNKTSEADVSSWKKGNKSSGTSGLRPDRTASLKISWSSGLHDPSKKDESEEVLMVDWFKLIRQKQLLMRRESELVYMNTEVKDKPSTSFTSKVKEDVPSKQRPFGASFSPTVRPASEDVSLASAESVPSTPSTDCNEDKSSPKQTSNGTGTNNESEEVLMVDWFKLIRQKQLLMRRESELVYISKTQDLEGQQPGVEGELRRLMEKPDSLWNTDTSTTESPADWRSKLKPVSKGPGISQNTEVKDKPSTSFTSKVKEDVPSKPRPFGASFSPTVKPASEDVSLASAESVPSTPSTDCNEDKSSPKQTSNGTGTNNESEEVLMVDWFKLIRQKQLLMRRESELVYISKTQDLEGQQPGVEGELRRLMEKPDESEEVLMVDWFKLIRQKQLLMRRESELVYISKTQDLEGQQPGVEGELRRLMEKPEHLKTEADRKQEEELMLKLVDIVNDRNAIIDGLDEDRLRCSTNDMRGAPLTVLFFSIPKANPLTFLLTFVKSHVLFWRQPGYIPEEEIQEELKGIEAQLNELEKKGVEMEKDLRSCEGVTSAKPGYIPEEEIQEELKGIEAQLNELEKKGVEMEKDLRSCEGGHLIPLEISPGYIPEEEIQEELKGIEAQLNELEKKGVEMEKDLRSCEGDESEEVLMVDWFKLIRQKQLLMRRESELVYISKTQDLEGQQPGVEGELRRLMEKPEHLKTEADRKQEEELMLKLVDIVNDRNAIIDGLDEDRLREEEEDQEMNEMMQKLEPGIDVGNVSYTRCDKACV
ncbi:UNVERIFIED_CONTAM: hypothetical protein FKN15_040148 [Acipenser sinensis]